MARPSPEELQRAKRAKQEEREAEAQRLLEEKEAMARKFEEETAEAKQEKARWEQLSSIVEALYQEMDKLNRKAPAMTISQLSLDRVNKAISAVKELMRDYQDEFIDETGEFVPAGDMPEYRDVTLILSQLRAGLTRFRQTRVAYWRSHGLTEF